MTTKELSARLVAQAADALADSARLKRGGECVKYARIAVEALDPHDLLSYAIERLGREEVAQTLGFYGTLRWVEDIESNP